jgi:murein DD-endopeptidase MepM/ murein hydrolase activator NlpD
MATAQSAPIAGGAQIPAVHWDGLPAVDIFAPEGTPWLAVFDGVAQPIDVRDGGNALLLTAADGTTAYYAHGLPDRASGPVKAGQVIGHVSDSGNAKGTGPHLHFAVGHNIDDQGAGDVAPADWLAGATAGNRDVSNLAVGGLLLIGALLLLDWIGG